MGKVLSKKEKGLMLKTCEEMNIDFKKEQRKINVVQPDLWASGHFVQEEELGRGASCRVLCVRLPKESNKPAALKEMSRKDDFNPTSFVKEISILKSISGHPNILQYEDAFIDDANYYIQTRLLTGGELFDRIHEEKKFSEAETSKHIVRILDGILHSHKSQIVHRDLKPENIVYRVQHGGPETLCIIDFGDAKLVEDKASYEEFVGTAFYLPPEIVRRRKGFEMKKSDVWSIGVITYVLLTGRPPFWGNSNKEILKKIIKGKVAFPRSAKLTATAKHFVLNLVQKRIEKRFTIEKALNHPFIRNHNRGCIKEILQRHGISDGGPKASKNKASRA